MGAKATKMEGSYLPDTPTLNKLRTASAAGQIPAMEMSASTPRRDDQQLLDPRSPNGCRTPMNFLLPGTRTLAPAPAAPAPAEASENAFAQLRKRILKGFALNDPRSPQLNRTPLMLDEAIDRTLNMDDTFADLFVETRAPATAAATAEAPAEATAAPSEYAGNNSSLEIVSLAYDEEETMPCDMLMQATPPPAAAAATAGANEADPRSPSLGVERTPIIFCDDDDAEALETQMLEQILETLTLNLSNESSSMASFVSASSEQMLDEMPAPAPAASQSRPANKHLERVRLGNKRRVAPRKPARAHKPQIYVDSSEGVAMSSTPKKATPNAAQSTRTPRTPRTPLGCVNRNRQQQLRSRSMEKDLRKTPLPLQSFDDQL
ncbi:hypothetical protein KR222_007059, partial [Zaprionus bogoriensis]